METPAVLQLLGHELRWQIVNELLKSDLKVGELTAGSGQAQNLVSYHLRMLREAGLVRERRSSADGRDVYYSLDRRTTTNGLLGVLVRVNPGAAASVTSKSQASPGGLMASVLLLCTGNSARSQIAEVMLRRLGGRHVRVRSGGTRPAGIHPQVHAVLKARGIDSAKLRSKSVTEFAGQEFDYVVTLCDIARTEPINVGGEPRLVHWSIPDPTAARNGKPSVATAFERVAGEIEARVNDFYADLLVDESAA